MFYPDGNETPHFFETLPRYYLGGFFGAEMLFALVKKSATPCNQKSRDTAARYPTVQPILETLSLLFETAAWGIFLSSPKDMFNDNNRLFLFLPSYTIHLLLSAIQILVQNNVSGDKIFVPQHSNPVGKRLSNVKFACGIASLIFFISGLSSKNEKTQLATGLLSALFGTTGFFIKVALAAFWESRFEEPEYQQSRKAFSEQELQRIPPAAPSIR